MLLFVEEEITLGVAFTLLNVSNTGQIGASPKLINVAHSSLEGCAKSDN